MPLLLRSPRLRMILTFSLAGICCAAAFGLALPAEGDLTKLAEGVFVSVVNPDGNAVGNAGVVVLSRAVLVYDTHFTPEAGQALLTKIQAVTPKPVRYLVNSHFHSDHMHGNQSFPRAQYIFASNNGRRDILQKDIPSMSRAVAAVQAQIDRMRKDAAALQNAAVREALLRQAAVRKESLDRLLRLRIIPPTVTFDDTLVIQDGPREVRLIYLGVGHTDGDIVLFLPAEKVVFLGDLFFNSAFPNTQDANLLAWMKTLEEVLKLEAEKFVPGHGSPGTRKEIKEFLEYLEELKTIVASAVARGDSLEQLLRETPIPSRYSSYRFPNFFPSNLQKMYAELKALQLASASEPEGGSRKPVPEKPQP